MSSSSKRSSDHALRKDGGGIFILIMDATECIFSFRPSRSMMIGWHFNFVSYFTRINVGDGTTNV